jgi:hypothetical protein
MEQDGLKVRTAWYGRAFDPATRLEKQVCRFEILSGPEAGTVTEAEETLRRWNFAEWAALIDDSAFTLHACYDGNSTEREPLPFDRTLENRWLLWHELALPRS